MIEVIGVIASCFVLLSFVFKKATTIRTVNIIGATLFVVYGILSNALSVWLLNGVLIFVHIYYLTKSKKE